MHLQFLALMVCALKYGLEITISKPGEPPFYFYLYEVIEFGALP